MQVSWIDSDHLISLLRDLGVERLEPMPGKRMATEDEGYTPTLGLTDPTDAPAAKVFTESVATPMARRIECVTEVEGGQGEDSNNPTVPSKLPEQEEVVTGRDEVVASEVERIRDRLREVRERAEAAGLLRRTAAVVTGVRATEPVTTESTEEPTLTLPEGGIAERLDCFADWVRQHLAAQQLVLLDEQGDVLWGPEGNADLVLSVMLAARAASRSSAAWAIEPKAGQMVSHQVLGAGRGHLSVLACPTSQGVVVLGVEGPQLVTEKQAAWLKPALKQVIEVEVTP